MVACFFLVFDDIFLAQVILTFALIFAYYCIAVLYTSISFLEFKIFYERSRLQGISTKVVDLVRNNGFTFDCFSLSDIPVILHHSLDPNIPFLPGAKPIRNLYILDIREKMVNES